MLANILKTAPGSARAGRDHGLQDPLADITRRLKVIAAVAATAEVALRGRYTAV